MVAVKKSTAKPLAYVGIVLGILSFIILAIVFGTLAIIVGIIALTRATEKERSICYVAIALGIIGLILWAIMVVWLLS